MLVTRDTSHLEMSALNDDAPANKDCKSVILDTSQVPIGPWELAEQSPSGDSCRQVSTANFSSSLDCGEKTAEHGMKISKDRVTQSTHVCIERGHLKENINKSIKRVTFYGGTGRKLDIFDITRTTYRNSRNVENNEEQHSPARFHTNLVGGPAN